MVAEIYHEIYTQPRQILTDLSSCCTDFITTTTLLLHPFNGLFSRTTRVSRYQKGKTSLDLNEARDDGVLRWQWHQLDHMQTSCTLLQTDNHTNTSSLKFLQARCSSRRPTNSVKALKAKPLFIFFQKSSSANRQTLAVSNHYYIK